MPLISNTSAKNLTSIISKNVNYTIANTDFTIEVNANSGNRIMSLPPNTNGTIKGSTFCIIKTDSTDNTIIVQPSGVETINGIANISITDQWQSVYVQALSTGNWAVVANTAINAPLVADEQAILLCNFNGANNSTVFTDLKGHSIGYTNNAKISTAQFKVGDSSLYLDGSSVLTIPSSADFDFLDGDFSIAFWYYHVSTSIYAAILNRNNGNYPFSIYNGTYNGFINLCAGTLSSFNVVDSLSAGTPVTNTWVHYAFTRSGNTFKNFKNGALVATTTSSGTIAAGSQPFIIGANAEYGITAYMNRLEIYKSAKYNAPFTPSVLPLTL